MSVPHAKSLINRALGRRPADSLEEIAYRRLVEKGFTPDGIIDVGAYQGEWTRLARRHFNAPVLMVEAQAAKRPYLDRVCADLPRTMVESAVLGATAGETVTFYEMETGSSFLPEQSNAPRTATTLITSTLDTIAATLPGEALFLKIDVQGAELHVLTGGTATLARCALVQLEVAVLSYNEGAPTMLEVLSWMDARGFVPFDLSGESRPMGHLVQIDILFVPRASKLRPDFIEF